MERLTNSEEIKEVFVLRALVVLFFLMSALIAPAAAETAPAAPGTPAPAPAPAPAEPPVWPIPGWKAAQSKGPFEIPVAQQWIYRKQDTTIVVTLYGKTLPSKSFAHTLDEAHVFDTDTTVIKQVSRQQYHLEGEDHLRGNIVVGDWVRLPDHTVSAVMIGPKEEIGTLTRLFYNRVVRKIMHH
jgi:hypothetical protein